MIDPRFDLNRARETVLSRLLSAPRKRDCPFRLPALATAGRDGGAEARMVVLRDARPDPLRLIVHTDAASGKVGELAQAPRATLLFWDPAAQLQLRVRTEVTARQGTPEDWAKIPDAARRAYGGDPAPGTVIGAPEDHDSRAVQERHMILTAEALEIEALWIGAIPHARALFRARDVFQGEWLAP